jgi:hypothetical protein
MRTDSLKGQKEERFSIARNDQSSKSIQENIHHHRKYQLINADLVASWRWLAMVLHFATTELTLFVSLPLSIHSSV